MLGYRPTVLFLILVVTAGITLRLAYPADIEFKADERWSFDQARTVLEAARARPRHADEYWRAQFRV